MGLIGKTTKVGKEKPNMTFGFLFWVNEWTAASQINVLKEGTDGEAT